MPTGYTQPLYDGEDITFEQFVLRCSRAMGAAIMQRDESPDVEIRLREVDQHYVDNVEKAGAALVQAWGRPDETWAELQAAEIVKSQTFRDEYVAKSNGVADRYTEMLLAVQAWEPPTSEHQGLKEFMVSQIEDSLDFDISNYVPDVVAEMPVSEYREREIVRLALVLEQETTRLQEERDRVRSQNAWVNALRESLGLSSSTPTPA
jgi:hypothetical protein